LSACATERAELSGLTVTGLHIQLHMKNLSTSQISVDVLYTRIHNVVRSNASLLQSLLYVTLILIVNTRVYPEVSGLAVWSENCKWYSSLPLGAVVSLFCESF
jgi:hypothetical protein